MRETVERLREKAQNEKTVIGLSDLLRLAKEENKALRTRVARLEDALRSITKLEHTATPGQMREIARQALERK